MKIAVAGTGYVGLSLAVLLSQHNEVHALDIVPEKVEKLKQFISPIQDDEIERFLSEAKEGKRELSLHVTLDTAEAYAGADYAIVATPTNYDSDRNFFDTKDRTIFRLPHKTGTVHDTAAEPFFQRRQGSKR